MELGNLNLSQFRSHASFDVSLNAGTTLIVGDNATGKTNLLEAIYSLAITKSFRADLDHEMIAWGQTSANISGMVVRGGSETTLRMLLIAENGSMTKKHLWVNGVGRRTVDYFGTLAVLLFVPADVELVVNSPSARRHHLDLYLAQADREYKRALTAYGHVITQRNKLLGRLREGEAAVGELTYWDQQMLGEASIIHAKRQTLFDYLAEQPTQLGPLMFVYQPRRIDEAELRRLHVRDIAAGQTTAGPHRDDFCFLQKGRDLAHFGSRGEQRTAVLALKLGELGFMRKALGESPVLLLDDIFSELDHAHREHILDVLPHQQTIITTTDMHLVEKRFLDAMNVLTL